MLATMLPTVSVAAKETASYTLSLEKGNITTSASALLGYDASGSQVEIPFADCTKGAVTVTGTANTSTGESNRIDVTIPSGYNVAMTLKNVSRTSTAASASDGIVVRGNAGGTLTLYIDGENKFYDTAAYGAIVGGGIKVVVEGLNGPATDKLILQHGLANTIGSTGDYEFKNVSLEFPELDITEFRSSPFTDSGKVLLDTTAQIVDKSGTVYPGLGADISKGYEQPEVEVKASATGADSTWVLPQSVNGVTYLFLPSNTDYASMYFPAGLKLEGNNGKTITTTAVATDVAALFTETLEPGTAYDLKIGGDTVKIIRSANIGALHMDLDEDNLDYVHSNKENTVTGKMVFVDQDGNVTTDTVPKFKGRGNHTWTAYAKKPYNFNTKSKHTLTGGTKTKKYSLLANADDGSMIRNKVGMDLADKLGVGLGGQVPVDLWIDGQYRGNYLLTVKNDANAPEPGYQIEIDNNTEPSVEAGGDPQFRLNNWVESGYVNRFTVKAIEGYTTAEAQAKLQTIWDAIRDTGSDDYMQYLNMESWANFYLMQEFIRDGDPVSGSKLMRYFGEEDKLYGGPIWDLGYCMGRTYDNGRSGGLDILSAEGWWVENLKTSASYWLQELGKHESFMQEVYRQYNLHKADIDAVSKETAELDQTMAASAAMNYTLWNLASSNLEYVSSNRTVGSGKYVQTYIRTNTWSDFVTNLVTYTETRARFMADEILNGSVALTLDQDTLTAVADCSGTDLTYVWYADGVKIENAGGTTLDAAAYAGQTITVTATAASARGTLTSNAVAVPDGPVELPDVTVRMTGESSTHINAKDVAYTVSLENTVDLANAIFTFEIDPTYYSAPTVTGLNGFQVLSTQTKEKDGKLYVAAIVFLPNGSLTSKDAVEVAQLHLVPTGESGETTVTLTKAQLSVFSGAEGEDFVNAILADTAVKTTIAFNIYDVNRDGVVNLLDVTRAQRHYGDYDANADVNGDKIVDITDLILILNNFTV